MISRLRRNAKLDLMNKYSTIVSRHILGIGIIACFVGAICFILSLDLKSSIPVCSNDGLRVVIILCIAIGGVLIQEGVMNHIERLEPEMST